MTCRPERPASKARGVDTPTCREPASHSTYLLVIAPPDPSSRPMNPQNLTFVPPQTPAPLTGPQFAMVSLPLNLQIRLALPSCTGPCHSSILHLLLGFRRLCISRRSSIPTLVWTLRMHWQSTTTLLHPSSLLHNIRTIL